jgi:FKBP-type peptidyl-prolyl cis-trans isomerase SlyD
MTQHQVGPGTIVHVGYELYDEEDALVETSGGGVHLAFLFGYGQLSVTMESVLDGARVGDTRTVMLPPEEGFGPRDPDGIIELNSDEFPPGTGPGDEFEAEDEQGDSVCMRIVDMEGDKVWVDTNHPLAGQTVRLELHVEHVRPATSGEVAQAEEALSGDVEDNEEGGLLPIERLLRNR